MSKRSHREIFQLRSQYGDAIPFYKDFRPTAYTLLTEMEVEGNRYAVVQNPETGDDAYIYKVRQADNSYHFEPLNDVEWEKAVDAYDEWLYFQERG